MARQSEMDFEPAGGNSSSFAIGVLCGAAVGATLALLFAPRPGADLRRDLAKSAGNLKRGAQKMYDDVSGVAKQAAEEGAGAFNEVMDGAKARAREFGGNSL